MRDWENYSLSAVADIRVSNVDKKTKPSEKPVRLCNYMDVYSNNYITSQIEFMEATAAPSEVEKFRVSRGDVLITKDSETPYDIGIPSVTIEDVEELVCGYHLALIKPDQEFVDSVFLCKWLEMGETGSYFSRYAAGSTRYGLSNGAIANTPIKLPPLLVQKSIGRILETVDKSIEKTETLIEKYQKIKAGLMQDLFTRGIGPDGKLRPPREEAPELYQETPIGFIPREWDVVSLNNELAISHGFAFPGSGFFDEPPGEVLLTPGNFHRLGGLYFEAGNTKYFRGFAPKETILSKGEIVTVMTDLSPQTLILGRFALVDTEFSVLHNQRIGLVTMKNPESWRLEYLVSALNSERLRREVIVGATGTTVRHTSPARILDLSIAKPRIDEQVRVADKLAMIEKKLSFETSYLRKLSQQKKGLMSDLLTGKVSVVVDTKAKEEVFNV